jgi:ABC-2 family transporter protein
MIWVTWRQHRREALVSAVVLAGIGVFLLVTARLMGADAQSAAACHFTFTCAASQLFQNNWQQITGAVWVLLIVLPALLGMFIAAPLLSGEFERGTHLLAWSQSITRLRWGTVKLGFLIAVIVIATAGLALLAGWWRTPTDQLSGPWDAFDIEGVAPVAYATFAFALGTFLSLVLRRTVPAMAATLVVFTVVRSLVEANRHRFQTAVVGDICAMPQGSWQTSFPGNYSCGAAALNDHSVTQLVAYYPPDRFWAFQFIEAGIFFALAALLIGVSLWWLQHRAT